MLHHISLGVLDIEQAAVFYDRALAPLGYVRVWSDLRPGERGQAIGYGLFGNSDKLALKQIDKGNSLPCMGLHVAFSAKNCDAVDEFYMTAIAAGAKDNGAPGLREHYGPGYYAAFIIDPEGYRIEAVCNEPSSAESTTAGDRT